MDREPNDEGAEPVPSGRGAGGLADSPKDPVTGAVMPRGGPLDRAGTAAEAEEGMTNEPIPLANEEPDVGLTEPLDR